MDHREVDADHHGADDGDRRHARIRRHCRDGEAIRKMVKGAKLGSLEAAHLSNIEQPKPYADAVLSFLQQN